MLLIFNLAGKFMVQVVTLLTEVFKLGIYICEDCPHMPRITIVLPLYSDLESSAQVTVGVC